MSPLHIVFIRTHLIFHKLRNYHSPSILYSLGIYACIAAPSALFHRYPSPVGISKQAEGLCVVRYSFTTSTSGSGASMKNSVSGVMSFISRFGAVPSSYATCCCISTLIGRYFHMCRTTVFFAISS